MTHGWQFLTAEDRRAVLQGVFSRKGPCAGPFHLEINPVDRCNANCFFCNSAGFRRGETLEWTHLEQVMEKAAGCGVRAVRLSGGGEPLIHPQFEKIIAGLRSRGIRIDNVTTNGIALKDAAAGSLAESAPSILQVSLNYSEPETYAGGMGVSKHTFHAVCENVQAFETLLRWRGVRDSCDLRLQFLVARETLHTLAAAFELAARLRADGVFLKAIDGLAPERRINPEEKKRALADLQQLVGEYRESYAILLDLNAEGMGPEIWALNAQASREMGDCPLAGLEEFAFCLMPWYSMTILGSGNVYPCCMLLPYPDVSVRPLGNVKTQTLDKIWNGRDFAHYRQEVEQAMIQGGPVPMHGRLCRHTVKKCWVPWTCGLGRNLASREDFLVLRDKILGERRGWRGRMVRVKNLALRKAIDATRKIGNSLLFTEKFGR